MKILCCTDGSEGSRAILPHVRRMAEVFDAEVVLARVMDPRTDAAFEVHPSLEEALRRVEIRWQGELEALLSGAGIEGSVLIPRREWGKDIADAIIDAAKAVGADFVAMSSRGSGALRHALLGSVALGVISRSDLPVMTVAGEQPVRGSGPYHLVVTTDGSADSRSVAAGIAPLLAGGKARVTVLAVAMMNLRETEPDAVARVRPEMEAFASLLPAGVEADVSIEAMPTGSDASIVISRVAEELGADAIASATHGHTAIRHLVAGSVALGVLKKASGPVILVRSKPAG
jgi:nucleotide-binding universal stress UspA family protein